MRSRIIVRAALALALLGIAGCPGRQELGRQERSIRQETAERPNYPDGINGTDYLKRPKYPKRLSFPF